MFLIANLLVAVAQILDYVLWAYAWILLARVVISYINADPNNPLNRFLHRATEPVLARVRAKLPLSSGGFDFSPIAVWLAVMFLQRFLVRSLYDLAQAIN
ncbi:MAG: YggT family protein [Candidatus Binatota bacterium]|nr:YggT family protein [Candidatus Binatota bacterium]